MMFAAMAPVVGVLFYNLYALHDAREREIKNQAFQAGQLAALEMQRILGGMEGILNTISSAPSILEFQEARCDAFLSTAVGRIPGVKTIGVIGLDGVLRCRHDQKGVGVSLADRPYFKEALKTKGFVIGEYTKSRITGDAILPLAAPLRKPDGTFIGVVAMSLDLGWLQKTLTERTFDTRSAVTLADRNGVILARHPLPERFIGTRIPDQYHDLVNAPKPGVLELTSQDGTRRVLAYFPNSAPPNGLYVSAGLSVDSSFHNIRRATVFGLAATAFAVVCSLLLAWQTNRHAIQKPVNRILNALSAWSSDKSQVRTGMVRNGYELDRIGSAVDGFMDQILAAQEQRALLEAEMGHRIKNLLAIVQSVAQQTFRGNEAAAGALRTYSQRLSAIGDAFTLLGQEGHAAQMRALVEATVAPFRHPELPQFDISGPDIEIGAKPALAIAMAIHELATNAVKYGALGEEDGRVLIR